MKSRVSTYNVNSRVQILEHVVVDLMMTFIANTILRVMFICAFSYALLSIEHLFEINHVWYIFQTTVI